MSENKLPQEPQDDDRDELEELDELDEMGDEVDVEEWNALDDVDDEALEGLDPFEEFPLDDEDEWEYPAEPSETNYNRTYSPVAVQDTLGTIILGILSVILLLAFMRSEARYRKMLERLHGTGR